MFKKSYLLLAIAIAFMMITAFGCKKAPTNNSAVNNSNVNAVVANNAVANSNEFPIINTNQTNANENASANANTNSEAIINSAENATNQNQSVGSDDQAVIALANKISEIYGTFTNKDKEAYKNLKTIKTYSTDKMNKWIDSQVAKPIDQKAPFFGVTTKALSTAIVSTGDKKMTVLVTTKREEITAQNNKPTVKYQILQLDFVKSGTDWKLDSAFWL